ncbi:hypothetical protein [Actinomadura sp. 7K507]|uniref:hypothetical protein n=1 Tax=Actinomadura sp. 7K507 TaxID=2530365 RepID=UPI0014051CED|nr:hypothetical protein [Actinomadura sp. 7K507]
MAKPRSTSKPGIRTRCQEVIDVTVGDHFRGYEAFAALLARPDFPSTGPVMAEVFADSIQRGCRALGAVTSGGLPDVDRFLPDERKSAALASDAVGGMPAQTMSEVRRMHRTNARTTRELVEAFAAHGPEQASKLYRQAAAEGNGEDLLMMLWAAAITVQRQVKAANAGGAQS